MTNKDNKIVNIGIDLGTTNSVLAYVNLKPNGDIVSKVLDVNRPVDMYSAVTGQSKLSKEKKPTLPSFIYYVEENGYRPIVGDFAKKQYSLRPHLVAKSIKSQMGKPYAEGLSPDIPDKKPSQISAQILKHLLSEASSSLKTKITDAVITVPANFDSAMCKATKDAAELAGIKVRNDDGSERKILLSEPNAVIYDLFNQIRNGEIPSTILDLSETKKVLVFDLGGGTLDITMHEIRRRHDVEDGTLKISEIATNRYTLLGGDDFDEAIAEEMFKRYVMQYKSYPEQADMIRKKKNEVMPQLRVFAENLKIELNTAVSSGDDYNSGWFDDDECNNENSFDVGGNIHSIGLAYDDTFSQEEIENILSVYMADDLKFDDYKKIENISNTRNIIFPILDVLEKAGKKLDTDSVRVDAVIVNGGMSKFYMVTNRLTRFFGFEPIVVLDPDQSVARGAAVYHYLLTHNSEDLTDEMKAVGDTTPAEPAVRKEKTPYNPRTNTATVLRKNNNHIGIEWGRSILNDCLYLGLKNGVKEEIIPTGAELSYTSEIKKGFQIPIGQDTVAIPIQSRNLDGTYRNIAKGSISFSKKSSLERKVAFVINMDENKVITMKAWTYFGNDENDRCETGIATIAIDNTNFMNAKGSKKIIAPSGSKLNPHASVNSLIALCQKLEKNTKDKKNISNQIKIEMQNICSAVNKKDFSEIVVKALKYNNCNEARMRLFIIARRLMSEWEQSQKKEIANLCISQLGGILKGFDCHGARKNVNIQAVYTLGFCGNENQLKQLEAIHNISGYQQSCIYAHAISKTCVEWLIEKFNADIKNFNNMKSNNLQMTAYAVGLALNQNNSNDIVPQNVIKTVDKLSEVVSSGALLIEQLTPCILSLGWICDRRNYFKSDIDSEKISEICNLLTYDINYLYTEDIAQKCQRSCNIALKLIGGEELSEEDEKYLLEKIECIA